MNNSNYEELFISEAEEYIELVSNSILILEKDRNDVEAVNNIFRGMHTIKGMAASMGYIDIAQLAHSIEDVMELIRSGKIEFYSELIDVLLKGNDIIDSLVHKKTVDEGIIRSFKSLLKTMLTGDKQASSEDAEKEKKTPSIPSQNQMSANCIQVTIKDAVLKSARAYMVIKLVQDAGLFLSTSPSMDDILKENFDKSFFINLNSDKISRELLAELRNVPEVSDISIIKAKQEDDSFLQESEIKKDIKVSLERLDNLQNYASELVIARGRLQQLAYQIQNEELINSLNSTSKIITNIQDEVMKIRMVPVWQIFDRYLRYIRDLANKLDKQVDFEIRGRDIELDRTLLNTLADPLLHLLRNAIDHGIETPEERKKQGKSEKGKLILEAKRMKNAVVISIIDDGKGLDHERILEKAVEKNLITLEQSKNLSKQEIFHFISSSGFSTKDDISEISGRGVGVDVVKNALKRIGGAMEIDSELSKGTTINLKVPLTLAIIKALIIRVGEEKYIVPLTHVSETIDIKYNEIQKIMGRDVFVLRNSIIPIIHLSEVFKISKEKNAEKCSLVIVGMEENPFGILIDEFIEQSEIVVKSLKGLLSGIHGLAGVTILNDGIPSFIIDVSSIFELAKTG